jgi:hypothetical protein
MIDYDYNHVLIIKRLGLGATHLSHREAAATASQRRQETNGLLPATKDDHAKELSAPGKLLVKQLQRHQQKSKKHGSGPNLHHQLITNDDSEDDNEEEERKSAHSSAKRKQPSANDVLNSYLNKSSKKGKKK